MTLVLYDLETTGRNRHFDQIVQFGAVRLDDALNVEEHFEAHCRLLPHIVPAPSALRTIGQSYADLSSTSRPSHFTMVVDIHRWMRKTPAAFLGYNSIRFDEEFLRHAFYQCLLDPYLTSTGNARGDVLRLARAVSQLRPEVLPAAYYPDGTRSMRLHDVAMACGFRSAGAHEAMADVEALLWIAKTISEGAPDLWSRFMQFSSKSTAMDFMREESVFIAFEAEGRGRGFYVVTVVGKHPVQEARWYCMDLTSNMDLIRAASEEELVVLFSSRESPLRRIKANASPLLFPAYEVLGATFPDLAEEDLVRLANGLRTDEELLARLNSAAFASERQYDKSDHVEQQLYDGFFSDGDKALMEEFHNVEWPHRAAFVRRFSDARLQRLAQRIVYFEKPHLLDDKARGGLDGAVRGRWTADTTSPWLTAAAALAELDVLDASSQVHLAAYKALLMQTI